MQLPKFLKPGTSTINPRILIGSSPFLGSAMREFSPLGWKKLPLIVHPTASLLGNVPKEWRSVLCRRSDFKAVNLDYRAPHSGLLVVDALEMRTPINAPGDCGPIHFIST